MDPLLVDLARWEYVQQIQFPSKKFQCCDPHGGSGFLVDNVPVACWDVWVLKQYVEFFRWRTARLVLTLPGQRPCYEYETGKVLGMVAVDSGVAGFFDAKEFEGMTIGDQVDGPFGIGVPSGLGDGGYELWCQYHGAARQYTLVFLEEDPPGL